MVKQLGYLLKGMVTSDDFNGAKKLIVARDMHVRLL
jgi:hypothetical protein